MNRGIFLLAIAGLALAARRVFGRAANGGRAPILKEELKRWEEEGGNLKPKPTVNRSADRAAVHLEP